MKEFKINVGKLIKEGPKSLEGHTKIYTLCDKKRHLVCVPYSIANLHYVAEQLGIKRGWFHKDHYDIPLKMIPGIYRRVDAVITTRQVLAIIKGVAVLDDPKTPGLISRIVSSVRSKLHV